MCFDPDWKGVAAGAAAWLHGARGEAPARKAIAEDWRRRHFTIMDSSCPPLPDVVVEEDAEEDGDQGHGACLAAGVCLGSARGRKIASVHRALLAVLKAAFPRGHTRSSTLVGGFVVGQLTSRPGRRKRSPDIDDASRFKGRVVYLHIGLMYLSPFRPTFAVMEALEDAAADDPVGLDHVFLKATGEFLRGHVVCSQMDFAEDWFLQLYLLESNARPIARMIPGTLGARKHDIEAVRLWPRHGGGRPGDGGHDGSSGDDDEGMEEEEEEEEEEGSEDGELDDELLELMDSVHDMEANAAGDLGDHDSEPPPAEPPAPLEGAPPLGEPAVAAAAPPPLDPSPQAGPAPAPGAPRARGNATATLRVPGGLISYYSHDGRFTAVCENPDHGDACVVTRYSTARSRCKGRPCGFLYGWLSGAPNVESKLLHRAYIPEVENDHAFRCACRHNLIALPSGPALVAHERAAAGDEPEPVRV